MASYDEENIGPDTSEAPAKALAPVVNRRGPQQPPLLAVPASRGHGGMTCPACRSPLHVPCPCGQPLELVTPEDPQHAFKMDDWLELCPLDHVRLCRAWSAVNPDAWWWNDAVRVWESADGRRLRVGPREAPAAG